MGTRKGSNAEKTSSGRAVKHKSTLNAKKANPVSRPKKLLCRPKFTKEWEQWEDQLVIALGKEGKSDKYTSQQLPGRTIGACQGRRCRLKARSPMFSSKQKEVLDPRKDFSQKEWEEWEDQIIITHHRAGESWGRISKLLPLRTAGSVVDRWKRANLFQEPRPQESVDLQTQSPKTLSIPKPVKLCRRWEQEEDQLLKSLHALGKSFAEIARQLPNRSALSCKKHWHKHLRKTQGPSTHKNSPLWEEWEERLLVSGHYAGLSWNKLSEPITGRTVEACRSHWSKHFASPDQDESWTPEELALLTYLRGEGSGWDEISQELPGHTSNACRMQWYRETEGLRGPSNHQRKHDTWSAEEVEVLVALYNTIGPRWEVICRHIPGRTEIACEDWFHNKVTREDGIGGPPSEFWTEFLMSKLHPRKSYSQRCSKLIS